MGEAEIEVHKISQGWLTMMKVHMVVVPFVATFLFSYLLWSSSKIFDNQRTSAVLSTNLATLQAAGPRHTKVESDLADAVQTKEIMTEVRNLVKESTDIINSLAKSVDEVTRRVDKLEHP